MIKEMVICIIIIVSIISLDLFTQNFTEKTVEEVNGMFDSLKENISSDNMNEMQNDIENLERKWEEMSKKLAYYIEHDELEKVETAIVMMKSYWQSEDYPSAIARLEEGKFVLKHIEEKNSFNLKNIL